MNIFLLSAVAREAARLHCDKHVVKMILESIQLLTTAQHLNRGLSAGGASDQAVLTALKAYRFLAPAKGAPLEDTWAQLIAAGHAYRPTHASHPSARWARAHPANYNFLSQLASELCAEYTLRYGKTHACQPHAEWLSSHPPPFPPRPSPIAPPVGWTGANPTAAFSPSGTVEYWATSGLPPGCSPFPLGAWRARGGGSVSTRSSHPHPVPPPPQRCRPSSGGSTRWPRTVRCTAGRSATC